MNVRNSGIVGPPPARMAMAMLLLLISACEAGVGGNGPDGGAPGIGGGKAGSGGSTAPGSGGAGVSATGGASPTGTGGATTGPGGRGAGSGGASAGTGGRGTGGRGGAAGAIVVPGTGGAGGAMSLTPLDCGSIGWAVENWGPPANRVNYAILADGYTATSVNTTLMTHINNAMAKRFSDPVGQVYLRYRKFVNICVIKLVSQSDGIGTGPTALSCTGDDASRLARCDSAAAAAAFSANLPATFMMDWRAIVLNNTRWWNTGSALMLWSGGNADGPGAALHEGGHGFHALADEYCASGAGTSCGNDGGGANGMEFQEVNSTGNGTTSTDKWPMWLGYTQAGATGIQGLFVGSRYVNTGQYRPSANSMMNSLFGTNPNTSFNAVSREKMVMDIWRNVVPVDSAVPPAGAVTSPATLKVNVIDSAVIDVDWSVDGAVVAAKGGPTFDVAARGLTSGAHTVAARAYDNATTDLVRQVPGTTWGRMNWARSVQTITWTVTIP